MTTTQYKTDKEWEEWGRTAPWYGVLSEEAYKGKSLSKEAKIAFYETGKQHISGILAEIYKQDPKFTPGNIIDFGCGTGRLLFPFAEKAQKATGIDVSKNMIEQAKKNQPKKITNINYIIGDGSDNLPGPYNLIHSTIVFQHINPARGYGLTKRFLESLEPGGFAALHYTVYDDSSRIMKFTRLLRRKSKFVNMLANLYMRRSANTPNMQMNMYDLGRLLKVFNDNGVSNVQILTSNPDCYVGVMIIGQKLKQQPLPQVAAND